MMRPERGREAGFTIMEILIAAAILVVGLIGILALFPVAVSTGKRSIEDTNAVLIAQSVEHALREGMTQRKGQSSDGKWTYFLFQHDGVLDALPRSLKEADPSKDYYILLPDIDAEDSKQERQRTDESTPFFVYPESDGLSWVQYVAGLPIDMSAENSRATPNGGGVPRAADDDWDDNAEYSETAEEPWNLIPYKIRRTYQLGGRHLHGLTGVDEANSRFDPNDPIYQYSFAFSLRRAYHDSSLGRHALSERTYVPASELFECQILVYRTFVPDAGNQSMPIFQTTVYLHK